MTLPAQRFELFRGANLQICPMLSFMTSRVESVRESSPMGLEFWAINKSGPIKGFSNFLTYSFNLYQLSNHRPAR